MALLWALTFLIAFVIAFIWNFCNDFLPKIVAVILLSFISTLLNSAWIFYGLHEDIHSCTVEHIFIILAMFICVLGLSYIIYEALNVFLNNSIE